jgi:SM-20-related protein
MNTSPIFSYRSISDEIAHKGYSIIPDFVASHEIAGLRDQALGFQASGHMHLAGIGQGNDHALKSEMRGDEIHWIEENEFNHSLNEYLNSLELLRQELNRSLSLGLFEFEGHFAIYPPGARYRKHLDQFQRDSRRTLTCILYLNTDWEERDGGQLRIYLDDENSGNFLEVLPSAGTLVTFLSSRFWHEVLPATRERVSLTGWYKTRTGIPI